MLWCVASFLVLAYCCRLPASSLLLSCCPSYLRAAQQILGLSGCTAVCLRPLPPAFAQGVEDNGHPRGLDQQDLDASLGVLRSMAAEVGAQAEVLQVRGRGMAPCCRLCRAWECLGDAGGMHAHPSPRPGAHLCTSCPAQNPQTPPGSSEGLRCAVVRVVRGAAPAAACYEDLRVAVAGGVDSGKSSLVSLKGFCLGVATRCCSAAKNCSERAFRLHCWGRTLCGLFGLPGLVECWCCLLTLLHPASRPPHPFLPSPGGRAVQRRRRRPGAGQRSRLQSHCGAAAQARDFVGAHILHQRAAVRI